MNDVKKHVTPQAGEGCGCGRRFGLKLRVVVSQLKEWLLQDLS